LAMEKLLGIALPIEGEDRQTEFCGYLSSKPHDKTGSASSCRSA
jgi:hypothetical protein